MHRNVPCPLTRLRPIIRPGFIRWPTAPHRIALRYAKPPSHHRADKKNVCGARARDKRVDSSPFPLPSGEMEKKKRSWSPRDPSTDKSTLEPVGLSNFCGSAWKMGGGGELGRWGWKCVERRRLDLGGIRSVWKYWKLCWEEWNGGLERFGGMVVDVVCFFLELISRGNFEILVEEQGSVECELGRSSISFYQDWS